MADQLNISKCGVHALVQAQRIGFHKVGRNFRFTKAQLRDYIVRAEQRPRDALAPGSLPTDTRGRADPAPSPQGSGFVICGQELILDILSNSRRMHGVMALRAHIGSHASRESLYHDRVAAASAHLWDSATEDCNLPHVRPTLPGIRCDIVNVTYRARGFHVARGNP